MSKYGTSALPGVKTNVSGASLNLWGHSLILNGESGITCTDCEKEEKLPELLQRSSGFRQVVYKLYILGRFREESCDSGDALEKLFEDKPDSNKNKRPPNHPITVSPPPRPGSLYWSDTTTTADSTLDYYAPTGKPLTVDGTTYRYCGSDRWEDMDAQAHITTIDMLERHGDAAKSKLPDKVVQEKEMELSNIKKSMDNASISSTLAGDAGRAIDGGTVGNVSITNTAGENTIDTDVEQSTAQKLAKKLQEGGNYLTR